MVSVSTLLSAVFGRAEAEVYWEDGRWMDKNGVVLEFGYGNGDMEMEVRKL